MGKIHSDFLLWKPMNPYSETAKSLCVCVWDMSVSVRGDKNRFWKSPSNRHTRMSVIMDKMPEEFKDVCVPEFVEEVKPKRKLKMAKKVEPIVAPIVVAEPVVEVVAPIEAVNEVLDEVVDMEKEAKDAEDFIAECGGTIPMVKKYKEMLAIIEAKEGSVASSKGGRKAGTYEYIVGEGLGLPTGKYSATLIPYHKTDLTEVAGDYVWGLNVINKKRDVNVAYHFKILKRCKKGIYPVCVKDMKTGVCHKVGGGMIDVATADGVIKVYTMTAMSRLV